jgi:arginine decarboxylase
MIPAPKHIIIYKNGQGNLVDELYQEEQNAEAMLQILGY